MRKKLLVMILAQMFFIYSVEARWFGKREKKITEPQKTSFEVKSSDNGYSRLKNIFLCKGNNKLFFALTKIVSQDLSFTDQFDIELKKTDQVVEKFSCNVLFRQGVSLLTFFEEVFNAKKSKDGVVNVHVVVKDTSSGFLAFDKTVSLKKEELIRKGHETSAEILQVLTGKKGICLSSLAYCKQISSWHKVICVSDYTCQQNKTVVPSKTINLAPRWFGHKLLYSQLTRKNNRLMAYNTETKKHSVVLSYPGLNMQPAFSRDGKKVIVCLSGGRGNSELYMHDQELCQKIRKRVFRRLTWNGAHNVSPCILPDGNFVFCSDFQTGQPQIYHFDFEKDMITRLTDGKGYAAAPCYCEKMNMLVYSRHVNGIFQLFTLSLDNLEQTAEKQITFGEGNKHEPSWSEDGYYIAFSIDLPDSKKRCIPQIAAMNYRSRKIRVFTKDLTPKSFPRWTNKMVWD